MATKFGEQLMEQRLNLPSLVHDLNADGRLSDQNMKNIRNAAIGSVHPLVYLAEQKLQDSANPGSILNMDALLGWLSEKSGQPIFEIDPLKINVGSISEVMSLAFAQRHKILALDVREDEVVIASVEPYVHGWESNLEHVLRKPLLRVLADPRDIAKHTAEFYSMAGSVRGARGTG